MPNQHAAGFLDAACLSLRAGMQAGISQIDIPATGSAARSTELTFLVKLKLGVR